MLSFLGFWTLRKKSLLQYFDENYVGGTFRKVRKTNRKSSVVCDMSDSQLNGLNTNQIFLIP